MDARRLAYHLAHLQAACEARGEDGANVAAYFAWSFLDGYEGWAGEEGVVAAAAGGGGGGAAATVRPRYGLVRVDPATLERAPKLSALWMARHFFGDAGAEQVPCLAGPGGACAEAVAGGGGGERTRRRRRSWLPWGLGGRAAADAEEAAVAAVDWAASLD